MNDSPLEEVLKNSKSFETTLSNESKSDWGLFKKAINGVCLFSVVASATLGALSLPDTSQNNVNNFFPPHVTEWDVVDEFDEFSEEDVPIVAPFSYVFDSMSLDPDKTIIQTFDNSNSDSDLFWQNAFAEEVDNVCEISIPANFDQAQYFLFNEVYSYKNDFVDSDKFNAYLNTAILFHEASHCAHDHIGSNSVGDSLYESFLDVLNIDNYVETYEEVTADIDMLKHIENFIDESDITIDEFNRTYTSARMLHEIDVLGKIIVNDFTPWETAQKILDEDPFVAAFEVSPISVTELESQPSNQNNFFGVINADLGPMLENNHHYSHFTSQGLINSGISFSGFEIDTDTHINAFKEIAQKLGTDEGAIMYFSDQGETINVDTETLLVSLVALSADKSISNEARKLISNYLSLTEIIDFDFPDNIKISKRTALGDKTIIQLKDENDRASTFNDAFPSLIVIENDGSVSQVSTQFNGATHSLDNYSFSTALDVMSATNYSNVLLDVDTNTHNIEDLEEDSDLAFYQKFPIR